MSDQLKAMLNRYTYSLPIAYVFSSVLNLVRDDAERTRLGMQTA